MQGAGAARGRVPDRSCTAGAWVCVSHSPPLPPPPPSLPPSLARSLARSLPPSFPRSLARSLARSPLARSLSPALPALFLCLRSFHNENRRRLAGSWVGTSRRSKPTSAAASLPLTTTASRPGPPLFVDRPGSPSLAAGPARLGLRCPHLLCADYPPLMIYN